MLVIAKWEMCGEPEHGCAKEQINRCTKERLCESCQDRKLNIKVE
jgi:hypothetical protein